MEKLTGKKKFWNGFFFKSTSYISQNSENSGFFFDEKLLLSEWFFRLVDTLLSRKVDLCFGFSLIHTFLTMISMGAHSRCFPLKIHLFHSFLWGKREKKSSHSKSIPGDDWFECQIHPFHPISDHFFKKLTVLLPKAAAELLENALFLAWARRLCGILAVCRNRDLDVTGSIPLGRAMKLELSHWIHHVALPTLSEHFLMYLTMIIVEISNWWLSKLLNNSRFVFGFQGMLSDDWRSSSAGGSSWVPSFESGQYFLETL